MKKILISIVALLILSLPAIAQTLSHKQLTVNAGGGKSTSDNLTCQMMTGQTSSGQSSDGEFSAEGGFFIELEIPTDVDDINEYRIEFELKQNYPNPFNPSTTIEYNLSSAGNVVIAVYNILGQHIVTLVDEDKSAGRYQTTWSGTDGAGKAVASGVYMYRIATKKQVVAKKMMLMK